MSQSPLVPGQSKQLDTYLESWKELNRLVNSGRSFSGRERNCCFLNTRGKPFADVSATSGIDWPDDARGVAIVDWDRDGDLDFWVTNRTAPRVRLMRNNGHVGRRFLALRLQGKQPGCNRDAIGARVELWVNAQDDSDDDSPKSNKPPLSKRIKTLHAGSGFLSQSSKWIHFGLQPDETINHVVVRWPDGQQEMIEALEPGAFYRIAQGEGATQLKVEPADGYEPTQHAVGPLSPSDAADTVRIVLARRQFVPEIEYFDLTGETVDLEDISAPLLINLWADWCRPCVKELGEFAEQSQQLEEAGLRVVALHVGDPKGNREGVADVSAGLLKRLGFDHSAGIASVSTIKVLDSICKSVAAFHLELPLPSSFLIDRDRHIRVIYKGPVSVQQLLEDVEMIGNEQEDLLAPALAFDGVWHNAASQNDSLLLAKRMTKAGRFEEAIDYVTRSIDDASKPAAGQGGADSEEPDQDVSRMYHVLGTMQRDQGQLRQAIAAYRKAIRLDADYWASHYDLGTIYLIEGQYEPAGEHFAEALRIKPEEADVLNKTALVHLGLRRPGEAIAALEKAVQLEPDNPTTLRNLSMAHLRFGDKRKAVPYLTKLLQLQPDDAPLHLELGNVLNQLGQRRDALAHYRLALELRPQWIAPMNSAAWLMATQQEPSPAEVSEAVELAKQVCQMIGNPPQASALDTLAAALASAGRFEEAVEVAQQALEVAKKTGMKPLASNLGKRLRLYRQQRPYREIEKRIPPPAE